jgi:hypothetical protein
MSVILSGGPADGAYARIPDDLAANVPYICWRIGGGQAQHYVPDDSLTFRHAGPCADIPHDEDRPDFPKGCCCGND